MKSYVSALTLNMYFELCQSNNLWGLAREIKRSNVEGDALSYFSPLNREGWFYDRRSKISWIEVNGVPYTIYGLEKHFLEKLNKLNSRVLTKREVLAYKEVLKTNPPAKLKKELLRILDEDLSWKLDEYIRQERNFSTLKDRFSFLQDLNLANLLSDPKEDV